jgi:hypothetical protein
VHEQALGDDLAHGHARRERAERILEDELQFVAQRAHLLLVEALEMSGRLSK